MDKIMFCANCGAKIEDEHMDRCSYCGYIIERGAEEKFMHRLNDLSEKLDSVDEQEAQEYRRTVAGNLRKVAKVFAIVAAIAGIIALGAYGISKRYEKSYGMSAEERKAEMVWENENFPRLDVLYDAGEYEKAANMMTSEEFASHAMYNWKHYEFVSWYYDYEYIKNNLEAIMDEYGGQPPEWKISSYTWNLFRFYYREYAKSIAISNNEKDILDKCREELIPIIYNRFNLTDEEMDGFLDEYDRRGEGYLNMRQTESVLKAYRDRFR